MKKFLGVCVLLICFLCPFFSIEPGAADVIVLLDTSGTMLPSFEAVNNQVLNDIAVNFVRRGDTFHLISFNENANVEIAQSVKTEADVQNIVSRFRLLYPLGQNSDFLSALKYAQRYISSLNTGTMKMLVIVSDGILNPPKRSPYFAYTAAQAETEIQSLTSKIRRDGTYIYFIKAPFDGGIHITDMNKDIVAAGNPGMELSAAQERTDGEQAQTKADNFSHILESMPSVQTMSLPQENSEDSLTESLFLLPGIAGKKNLGKQSFSFKLPLSITNNSDKNIKFQLDGIIIDSINVLDKTVFAQAAPGRTVKFSPAVTIPSSVELGEHTFTARFIFSDNIRVDPPSLEFSVILKSGIGFAGFLQMIAPFMYAIVLIIAAILLIIAAVVFFSRSATRPHVKAFLDAAGGHIQSPADGAAGMRGGSAGYKGSAQPKKGAAPAPAVKGQEPAPVQKQEVYTAADTKQSEEAGTARPSAAVQGTAALLLNKAVRGTPQSSAVIAPPQDAGQADSGKVLNTAGAVAAGTEKRTAEEGGVSAPGAVMPQTEKPATAILSSFEAHKKAEQEEQQPAAIADDKPAPAHTSAIERSIILAGAAGPHRQKERRHAAVPPAPVVHKIRAAGYANTMLELFVSNQNTNIGRRNIHLMKPGTQMSIGGGRSDFLIFLVRFPARIAEIRYDGKNCSLAVLKPEYFPYAETSLIEDCIGKNVTVRSDKGYEVDFQLQDYEDPVLKLNRLLLSIKTDRQTGTGDTID